MKKTNKEQIEAYVARYRKTKNYKRDMAKSLLGKPVRGFIALRGDKDAFIENPVLTDLRQQKGKS